MGTGCQETDGGSDDAKQRVQSAEWVIAGECVDDPVEVLECLYNLNKHAKKYAKLGTENYRKGKKTTAKVNSVKKNALYGLKEEVLRETYEYATDVALHEIDGNLFYLVDFDVFSFHTPVRALPIPESEAGDPVTLDDFESTAEKEHSDKSLKASLQYFDDQFGLNANEFLTQKYASYGRNSHFIGWPYLGDSE